MKNSKINFKKYDTNKPNSIIDKKNIIPKLACRICLKGNDLIKVCNCTDIFEKVHKRCIEYWIELTDNNFCEFCKYEFKLTKYPKNYLDFCKIEHQDKTILYFYTSLISITLYLLSLGFALSYLYYFNISKLIGQTLFLTSFFLILFIFFFILYKFFEELFFYFGWRKNHFKVKIKEL